MAWPAGVSKKKTGGRKKGTPNARSSDLVSKFDSLEFDVVAELLDSVRMLDPRNKANVLVQLLGFLYPRRKAVELVSAEEKENDELKTKAEAESLLELLRTVTRCEVLCEKEKASAFEASAAFKVHEAVAVPQLSGRLPP
jgi:hypothetical protein